MCAIAMDLTLPAADRKVLTSILRSTSVPAALAHRAQVILALSDGHEAGGGILDRGRFRPGSSARLSRYRSPTGIVISAPGTHAVRGRR